MSERIQDIPFLCLEHSENCRLFIEKESLNDLRAIYRKALRESDVVLPDAPVIRTKNGNYPYEVLAGSRRIFAAQLEGWTGLTCRVVEMSDEEAFKFILTHNQTVALTTPELSIYASKMAALDYSQTEIDAALGGKSSDRYIAVGNALDENLFTDAKKLCDPGITTWFEALTHGVRHLRRCFKYWDAGLWNADMCDAEFRKKGKKAPRDNAEKGFRLSFSGSRLNIRGRLDLDTMEPEDAKRMLKELCRHLKDTVEGLEDIYDFGPREVLYITQE